jgi:glutathione S-transferase
MRVHILRPTFGRVTGPAKMPLSASAKFMPLLQYPVLETPGGAIRESVAICRYVASLGAGTLYPAAVTPATDIRGQIDAWVDWSRGGFLVLRISTRHQPLCCSVTSWRRFMHAE